MGSITIEGYGDVPIKGDAPTEAELAAIENAIQAHAIATEDDRPANMGVIDAVGGAADPLNRFYQGIADIPAGGAQLLTNMLPGAVVDSVNSATQFVNEIPYIGDVTQALGMVPATADQINQSIADTHEEIETARGPDAGFDWYRLGGNVAGTLPLAALGGASLPGAAASGGFMGALTPQTGGSFSVEDKGIQTATGMGGGVLGNVAVRSLARMLSPNVRPNVKALTDGGVHPTPGQTFGGMADTIEQKMTGVPLVGDAIANARNRSISEFNTLIFDDILQPVGIPSPSNVGREAVKEAGDALSAAYEDILPNLVFGIDRQFGAELAAIARSVNSDLSGREAAVFNAFVKDELARVLAPGGTMTGETFKTVESVISRKIASFSKSGDAFQRQLGDAFKDLQLSMREALARVNSGVTITVNGAPVSASERLTAINLAWAKLTRVERAAASLGAADGLFSPAQLLNAVKASDQTVRHRGFARGDALLQTPAEAGKDVLGSTVPDSGTPGRLAAMLTGGAVVTNPWLAAGGLAALPYTRFGQRLTSNLLTQRGPIAAQLEAVLRSGIPAANVLGANALTSQ